MPFLFLHAHDPLWRPQQPAALAARLQDLGLLGREAGAGVTGQYLAGHRFLQLLMFLGCSPRVALAPGEGESGQQMCSIRLLAFERPVFLLARPLPAVRCPGCRASATLPREFGCETQHSCSSCGTKVSTADLDWRQGAGCGSFFIEVSGIYPQEAVPSEKLLQELGRLAHCDWKYFFADAPTRSE